MTLRKPNRRKFIQTAAAASAGTTIGAPLIAKGDAEFTIKIGSLAPEGSDWDKEFKRIRSEVSEQTDGRVKIIIYGNGVMGDESGMIRKVRTGQLDGAAVTSVGLAQINKQLLVLQLPLLFKSDKQLDYVRDKMDPTFRKLLEDGGFVLGSYGDVGVVHIFSNIPVKTPNDVKSTKMWAWTDDPVTQATIKAAGVGGVELNVMDVLPSLKTGLINAFPAAPYASIALQWYTYATYVTNLRLAMAIGASVFSLKTWEKLPDDIKEVMNKVSAEAQPRLLKRIRRANTKAVKALLDKGITVVEPEDIMAWTSVAIAVRKELAGKLFPQSLLDEVDQHIKAAG